MMTRPAPRIGVIMGSDSDWSVMADAAHALAEFDVPFEVGVVSAHRTPDRMLDYAHTAAGRGLEVIIAGAGGAAHLPGMVASATALPVIGVPVPLAKLGRPGLAVVDRADACRECRWRRCRSAAPATPDCSRCAFSAHPTSQLRERMAEFQTGLANMVLEKDAALRDRLLGP